MGETGQNTTTEIPGCCVIRAPSVQTLPVVFSSPHSGRDYSDAFMATARLDQATLRRSEDSYVDEIFAAAPLHGAPLIAATFPRAFCDVNREAWELDPAMFEDILPPWVNTTSARVGAGLGTIARVVANGEAIYGIRLRFADAQSRVRACWQPYHDPSTAAGYRPRRRPWQCLRTGDHAGDGPVFRQQRLFDAPQRSLCRRLRHPPLWQAAERRSRHPDRNCPCPLYG
jgi:N-formylglutamate deformylase